MSPYLESPYARLIDYTAEPDPPLTSADVDWANSLLQQTGLRQTA